MSGGSMDYVFGRIDDAADSIETFRKEVSERPVENFEVSDIYKKEHPEIHCFESPEKLKAEVLRYLSQAVQCLRAASIYAYSVEWLESEDYGYDSFILKLRNKLDSLRESEKKRLEAQNMADGALSLSPRDGVPQRCMQKQLAANAP